MISLQRTNSDHPDFRQLVALLDKDLAIRNGAANDFFAQYNKTDLIGHVVVAYVGDRPVGCGAIKAYQEGAMEVKRMFVLPERRGQGIAAFVLGELEAWARELGCVRCVLETGDKMPEAIALYRKSDYRRIPNYGPYAGVESSVCFEKEV